MPTGPNTWSVLQNAQALVQSSIQINSASPFTLFSAEDQAKYGSTNAIYIGSPKDMNVAYQYQCHLVATSENVYRRSFGGKVWDELLVNIRVWGNNQSDWYATEQQMFAIRDVFQQMLMQHAELPGSNVVQASKEEARGAGGMNGFFFAQELGFDWYCWGTTWWFKSQWNVSTGIIA